MAKRMKIDMDSKVFSTAPVDRRVLANWREHIDIGTLREAISIALNKATFTNLFIDYDDSRQVASFVETLHNASGNIPILLRVKRDDEGRTDFRFMRDMLDYRVEQSAQLDIDDNIIWILMMLNTYRAMIQQLTGPMIGFTFNITIPGIVATCMRLGVRVDLDS